MRPDVLALIPARGGSKGLPRKNVLPVAGRPLIAHTVAHALGAATVTRTIVTTDDDEIAEAARAAGAEVPFLRPAELAGDLSLDIEAFRHALEWLRDHEGYLPELVVHLRPTHPLRTVSEIDRAVAAMLADPQADALRSVERPDQTPFKMWRIGDRYMEPALALADVPEAHSRPRQELPEVWWQNGYVDVIRPATILEQGSMAGRRVLPFIPVDRSPEIDHEDDLRAVERLLAASAGSTAAAAPADAAERHAR